MELTHVVRAHACVCARSCARACPCVSARVRVYPYVVFTKKNTCVVQSGGAEEVKLNVM